MTLFDAALNQTTTQSANHTEIYDPVTNTWTNGSDLPFKISSHAAVVHNDEIVIAGGRNNNLRYDQVRGYNPITGQLHAHDPLHTALYDFDMLNVDGALVYAGGDTSAWRFSNWGTAYSDTTGSHENPIHNQESCSRIFLTCALALQQALRHCGLSWRASPQSTRNSPCNTRLERRKTTSATAHGDR